MNDDYIEVTVRGEKTTIARDHINAVSESGCDCVVRILRGIWQKNLIVDEPYDEVVRRLRRE